MAVTKTVNVETTNARASTTLTDTTPTVPLPDTPQGLMVIGPQVTLHFVEGAWNKANSYDYYDVVQVDGTSYIAVQDVPANTEITNTEYWAKWNDPNAQVALLQETVAQYNARITNNETKNTEQDILLTQLETDVENITDKVLIALGDSWVNPKTNYYTHWVENVASVLHCTPYNYGDGGARMSGGAGSGTSSAVIDQVNKAISELTDDALKVKYIVIIGGVNDMATETLNVSNYVKSCNTIYSKLNAAFPNAKILHLQNAPLFDTENESNMQRVFSLANNINTINASLDYPYSTSLVFPMMIADNYIEDNLHPSSAGGNVIEKIVLESLTGSPFSSYYSIISDTAIKLYCIANGNKLIVKGYSATDGSLSTDTVSNIYARTVLKYIGTINKAADASPIINQDGTIGSIWVSGVGTSSALSGSVSGAKTAARFTFVEAL